MFEYFCDLGLSLRNSNNNETIKDLPIIALICQELEANEQWIQGYIWLFPTNPNHFDANGEGLNDRDLKVRSGIQFLLDYFSGISVTFDAFLKNLVEAGDTK